MTWEVRQGDCLELLKALPDGSVDAVVTDPPYGMAYQSAWRIDKAERFAPIANDELPFVWWLYDAARVLKDGGLLVCFCRWDSAETFRQAIELSGLVIAGQMIWDRLVHGMGDLNSGVAPRHDTIWIARKGSGKWKNGRPPSVMSHQRLGGDALTHPNEKPISLMIEIVKFVSDGGEMVLDPFVGSGSTGVACVQNARNFIGFEIDAGYCEIARKRIGEAANHLFAHAQGGQA